MDLYFSWFKAGLCVVIGFMLFIFAASNLMPCGYPGCAFQWSSFLFGLIPAVVFYVVFSLVQ